MVRMQNKNVKIIQGGYSDIRLWPCYMVISGLILILIPLVGLGVSLLAVGTPAILIGIWIGQRSTLVSREEYQAQMNLVKAEKTIKISEKEVGHKNYFQQIAFLQNI